MNSKIVYLKKISPILDKERWNRLIKRGNNLNIPLSEIIEKFSGIEGSISKLAPIKKDEDLNHIIESFPVELEEIFFVETLDNIDSSFIHSNLIFQGYDYGCPIKDEMDLYSSIFQEIIFGKQAELVEKKNDLNTQLLFNSFEEIIKYRDLHMTLAQHGIDVEHNECLNILKIHKIQRS